MNNAQRKMMFEWRKKNKILAKAHCQESVRTEKKNMQFGIPVVMLTAIAGTTVFATLQKQPHLAIQILVGFTSLLATVLASLQTFLSFAEKSAKHRDGAGKFENLDREIEQLLSYPIEDDGELDRRLTAIREENQRLTASYPNVPEHIWNTAVEHVEMKDESCQKA